jgi:DNA-binding LacI/PurR family transcriptional regulator
MDANARHDSELQSSRRGRDVSRLAYVRLCELIRASIRNNEYPSGRLPTERVLGVRHAVSIATVRKAIDLLVREGLVRRRQGSGTFISRPIGVSPAASGRRTHMLCYVSGTGTESHIGNFFNRLMVAVQSEVERAGYATVVAGAAGGRVPMPVLKMKVDGVIVAGTYYARSVPGQFTLEDVRTNNDFIRRVVEAGVPVVTVSNPTDCQSVYRVDPDYDAAMNAALSRLKELGHREIAVIGGPREWPAFGQRIDAFLRQSRRLGLESAEDSVVDYGTWAYIDRGVAVRRVREFARSHPAVSAAVVIAGSPSVVQEGLLAAGRHLPGDFSLVSFADIPRSEIGQPVFVDPDLEIAQGMSTLDMPVQSLARTAVQRLVAVVEGQRFEPDQQHLHVPLAFTPGISIQPLSSGLSRDRHKGVQS